MFCAALWSGPHGKELKSTKSELGRGVLQPRLVCRGGNLARAPEPCLKAHRNDKAKTGDGRSDVFKMRGDLITGHRISPVFFPFEQK